MSWCSHPWKGCWGGWNFRDTDKTLGASSVLGSVSSAETGGCQGGASWDDRESEYLGSSQCGCSRAALCKVLCTFPGTRPSGTTSRNALNQRELLQGWLNSNSMRRLRLPNGSTVWLLTRWLITQLRGKAERTLPFLIHLILLIAECGWTQD